VAERAFPGLGVMSAAAIVTCFVLAGCAEMPSGGAARADNAASSQIQAFVVPEPPPPPTKASEWTPKTVVLGFLHASASYAIDPSAAKAYLAPSARQSWHPGPVTVVGQPSVQQVPVQQAVPSPTGRVYNVTLTGQRLATLSTSGQYSYASGTSTYVFGVQQINGVYMINKLPPGQVLLLQESDFESVYQPRNLYFFAPQQADSNYPDLVPDPVYAPIEGSDTALNTTVATTLIEGLFNDSGSWLSGATSTAFPAGTKLKQLSIINQTAVVNLGGTATGLARHHTQQLDEMDEQLKATLTSASAYSPPVAHRVRLEINGATPYLGVPPSDLIPPVSVANEPEPIFFQNSPDSVAELLPKHRHAEQVLWPNEVGGNKISAIAAQPGGASQPPGAQLAAAVQAGNGCTVYVVTPGRRSSYAVYPLPAAAGPCTSLSWDSSDRIWVATARRIWVVQPGAHALTAVAVPDIPGTGGAHYKILALKLAPDAVRAALLIQQMPSAGHPDQPRSVLLAGVAKTGVPSLGSAVTAGTGLPGLRAISWLNAYNLAGLAANSIFQIPLTGGASQDLGFAPSQAQTLTTGNSDFVVSTTQDLIASSSESDLNWVRRAGGAIPAYPG
jgi:hypothetical protein